MTGTLKIDGGEVVLVDGLNKTVVAYLNATAMPQAQAVCDAFNGHAQIADDLAQAKLQIADLIAVNANQARLIGAHAADVKKIITAVGLIQDALGA